MREAADCRVGNCFCLPETNHTGARCEFAPAYTLSGCAVPEHCGVFARTNRTCDDAPAYQSDVGVSASLLLVSSLAIESTGRGLTVMEQAAFYRFTTPAGESVWQVGPSVR